MTTCKLLRIAGIMAIAGGAVLSTNAQVFDYDRGVSDLAGQLIQNAMLEKGAVIAVLPLVTLEKKETQEGISLAEDLTTLLFKSRRFRLVERQLLDKAIKEIKLQDPKANLTDPKTAQRLGKMVNAAGLVVGTHTSHRGSTKVNARIIGVGSGELLGAGSVEIEKPKFLPPDPNDPERELGEDATVEINETIYIGADWLTIIFDRVALVNRNFLKFTFTVKNQADDEVHFSFSNARGKSYLVDEFGNSSDFLSSEGLREGEQKVVKGGERFTFSLLFKAQPLKGQRLDFHSEWQAYGREINGSKSVVQKGIQRPR